MSNHLKAFIIAIGVFLLIVVAGGFLIDNLFFPFGRSVESCIIYLAGVVGAGLFWIGRDR